MSYNLTYLSRLDIEDEREGLSEPSGLALAQGHDGFWTVSDDTEKVFKLDREGRVERSESFEIPVKGLEGIALDATGQVLLAVKEETNEIVKLDIAGRTIVNRRRLAHMAGYDSVAGYFADGRENKGLEGITVNVHSGAICVVKEGHPGVLLEVSANLQGIQDHRVLSAANGFRDSTLAAEEIDFSGLAYDAVRHGLWIVSDKARRVFLYDWARDRVVHSAPLGYGKDGRYEEVEKAEGIAVDPAANRLYVVSDKEARLYVFDVRA